MAHSYHGYNTLQYWEQWLIQHELGHCLLSGEQQLLMRLLSRCHGKYAALIGVQHQHALFKAVHISHCTLFSPLVKKSQYPHVVETNLEELPLLSGSIDLVILPHILELVDNPRQLLAESCRVVKPEGYVVIIGFNPYSLWGLKKIILRNKQIPWSLPTLAPYTLKKWLLLADFRLKQQCSALFRPPVTHCLYDKLIFMEALGRMCWPNCGGVYILLAQAKVLPLTPIRLRWKQHLHDLQLPSSVSGHIARQAE